MIVCTAESTFVLFNLVGPPVGYYDTKYTKPCSYSYLYFYLLPLRKTFVNTLLFLQYLLQNLKG